MIQYHTKCCLLQPEEVLPQQFQSLAHNQLVLFQFQMIIHHQQQDICGKKRWYIKAFSPTYANLILFLR